MVGYLYQASITIIAVALNHFGINIRIVLDAIPHALACVRITHTRINGIDGARYATCC